MVEPSCVRGHGRRRARRTTVSLTLWTPFPFRPVHAWLVWCWPACVWSVYGQVAAAAAVLLVRGCLGRLMVGLVCVGSIALLPVVVPPHVVYAAGMSVSVLVSGVVVRTSVVLCSLLSLVGRVCIGSVMVFCCVRGHGRLRARRTTVSPTLGRRSRFDPCTPRWFGVGRLACGLFTVKWRLQRRCCWFAVVLAASWSACFAWVPLRCCRWSFCRMLFMQLACPCRCRLVASWSVQV